MTEPAEHQPSSHYRHRVEQLGLQHDQLTDREEKIAWGRLVVFAVFAILAWLGFVSRSISGWWSVIPLFLFVALVVLHARSTRLRERVHRRMEHNRRGLARIERKWDQQSEGGARFVDSQHPYAADLDLFGPASVFSLISIARTRAGESVLASWLLAPATRDVLSGRRKSVRELEDRLDLRESVAMLGSEQGVSTVDLDSFENQESSGPWSGLLRILMVLLAISNFATLAGWLLFEWTSIPFAVSIVISSGVAMSIRERVGSTLEGVEDLSGELDLLLELVEIIESQPFQSEDLLGLQERLAQGGEHASGGIRKLARLVSLLDSRRNQLFLPFAFLMFWSSQLAIALDRWKARFGSSITGWIETIGQFEAILSLSSFAWEHPRYVDAELTDREACFDGEGLGHPLIPEDRLVRNDVSLGETRLLIVSGSNMSGKSTLLRTVGVNCVLALAGAPVNARRLVLSPLQPGASIHVRDSLIEGKSRFYAEILRLRQIVELSTQKPTLLYLLDEVLHGTNSHDRTVGATAILKALVDNGALGLVTTHDLALARVEDDLGSRARNVHFEDHIEQDEMIFDYRMREGVVARSNALALMRRIGLDV